MTTLSVNLDVINAREDISEEGKLKFLKLKELTDGKEFTEDNTDELIAIRDVLYDICTTELGDEARQIVECYMKAKYGSRNSVDGVPNPRKMRSTRNPKTNTKFKFSKRRRGK